MVMPSVPVAVFALSCVPWGVPVGAVGPAVNMAAEILCWLGGGSYVVNLGLPGFLLVVESGRVRGRSILSIVSGEWTLCLFPVASVQPPASGTFLSADVETLWVHAVFMASILPFTACRIRHILIQAAWFPLQFAHFWVLVLQSSGLCVPAQLLHFSAALHSTALCPKPAHFMHWSSRWYGL